MRLMAIVLTALLAACSSGGGSHSGSGGSTSGKHGWYIGPVIDGKNSSVGMPSKPTLLGEGWYIDFPVGPKTGVDYVQNYSPPSLVGAKEIVMHYTVSGTGFMPSDDASNVSARVGLLIQRKGDDWSSSKQTYRWFSKSRPTLKEGEFTLRVPLEVASWHDVYGKSSSQIGFDNTIKDLSNISVVFGGQFAGHGVYTTTPPARFTMQSMEIVR